MVINNKRLNIAMANECLTVSELAKKSNVSRVTIRRLFNRSSTPKPATIGKIAKALNVQVEELLED